MEDVIRFMSHWLPPLIMLVGLMICFLSTVAATLILSLLLVEKCMKVLGVHKIVLEYILHRSIYKAWYRERKERVRERARRIEADIKRRRTGRPTTCAFPPTDDPQSTPPATAEEADERRQALKKIIEDARRDTDDPPDRLDG
jgi:hypothetical protein